MSSNHWGQPPMATKKPAERELLKTMLYKNGRLTGYVTSPSLYNQLGLTTQIPNTITIACNGGRQKKEFKTIRIKKIISRIPIEEKNIKLMQYLDALKDIKKINVTSRLFIALDLTKLIQF